MRAASCGGFAGVRDLEAGFAGPLNSAYEGAVALGSRVRRHNGADPETGRRHREFIQAAGFASSIAGVSAICSGTQEETTAPRPAC
jgi:hypothetical protein